MRLRRNNILSQLFNSNIVKTAPCGSKVILRHYHYRSDTKLGPIIIDIGRTPFICHACITQYLPWYSKIIDACNQPRYGRVYNQKYSKISGSHNNWILIVFLDDGADSV